MHPVDDALDDRRRRLATACYYGLCTWVDRQVGRVIGALERTGLTETTRVVYTSDHGDNIGARGMWGKSTHYDDVGRRADDRCRTGRRARAGSAGRPSASSISRRPSWRPSARTHTAGPMACQDARSSRSGASPMIRSARCSRSTMRSRRRPRPSCCETGATSTTTTSAIDPSCSISKPTRRGAQPGGRSGPRRRRCRVRSTAAQHARSRGHGRPRQGRSGGADRALRRPAESLQCRCSGSDAGADLNVREGPGLRAHDKLIASILDAAHDIVKQVDQPRARPWLARLRVIGCRHLEACRRSRIHAGPAGGIDATLDMVGEAHDADLAKSPGIANALRRSQQPPRRSKDTPSPPGHFCGA